MVSREIFIRNKCNRFVEYMNQEFSSNVELLQEMNKYKTIDIIFLVMWWQENVKSINDFIADIVERYTLTITHEQKSKIHHYLEVLSI